MPAADVVAHHRQSDGRFTPVFRAIIGFLGTVLVVIGVVLKHVASTPQGW